MKRIALLLMIMSLFLTGCSVFLFEAENEHLGQIYDGSEYEEFIQEQRETDMPAWEGADHFYYQQLGEDEKRVYNTLLKHACDFEEEEAEIRIGDISEKSFYRVHYALLYDHPEYFWLSKFEAKTLNGRLYSVIYTGMSEYHHVYEQLSQIGDRIANDIPSDYCTYEKIKYIYDYIVQSTDYVEYAKCSQDIRSVLLYKQSVCAGYAGTFKFLCDKAKIPCVYVSGTVDGVGHAWNMVQIGEEYYWVDTTWGEASYGNGDSSRWNYHYLCATDEELFATHTLNEGVQMEDYYEANVFIFPKCEDGSYNYYRLNKCYFETYDRDEVEAYLAGKLQSGQYTGLDMQFADAEGYGAAKQDLFGDDTTKGRIGKMIVRNLPKTGWKDIHYSYICDEHANFLSVDIFERE